MPSRNLSKILRYLEAIDQAGGSCGRMVFYNIAGNEANLSRWEKKLCIEWKLVEKYQNDGHDYYRKTDLGENLHKLLRNHEYVGGLFEELILDRLKPADS